MEAINGSRTEKLRCACSPSNLIVARVIATVRQPMSRSGLMAEPERPIIGMNIMKVA